MKTVSVQAVHCHDIKTLFLRVTNMVSEIFMGRWASAIQCKNLKLSVDLCHRHHIYFLFCDVLFFKARLMEYGRAGYCKENNCSTVEGSFEQIIIFQQVHDSLL